jgi:predicted MarR family transcription regulator
MKFKPSRLLNEQSGLFNLNAFDVSAIGYFLVLSHTIFSRWGLELLSFILSFLLFAILVAVRMNTRKKTIRDFIKSKLWRIRL